MTASMTAPISTNKAAEGSHPPTTRPSAVPAAGACSVFVKTMIKVLRPTDSTAMRSRAKCDPSANSPNPGMRYRAENAAPTITATTCPPTNPLRSRCLAMGAHEYDKGAGSNCHDDSGPEHHVDDQQDQEQRKRRQSALEEIVLPVAPELPIDQPAFQKQEAHRPPCAELTRHETQYLVTLPEKLP